MITAVLAVLFCFPLSLLLIASFFNQGIYRGTPLLSANNLTYVGLHSLMLASAFGSALSLFGYPFGLIPGLFLAVVIALSNFAIVWGLT